MFAFKRERNDCQSVVNHWKAIQDKCTASKLINLFYVILCDCGSEFDKPLAMESLTKSKKLKAHVFYSHPECSIYHDNVFCHFFLSVFSLLLFIRIISLL